MCDIQCSTGIGISAGVVGIMMTIICCKTLCEFLLELSKPDITQAPARTEFSRLIEMPIVIRIHFPQQRTAIAPTITVVGQQRELQRKNSFEPLPV